jgi:hypothetical protein
MILATTTPDDPCKFSLFLFFGFFADLVGGRCEESRSNGKVLAFVSFMFFIRGTRLFEEETLRGAFRILRCEEAGYERIEDGRRDVDVYMDDMVALYTR